MPVITISRGSYSWGKEVAEKVAQKLGYDCVGRDVLLEASQEFNIPEIKLVRAFHDAPSVFDRFTYSQERYVAYIQTAILKHLREDNVVYHGLAGHFFVRDIAHVLKVRIIADLEDRVKLVMERDGVSSKEALRFIRKIDEQRRKWSRKLYGIDTWDPGLYDLVLHLQKISTDDTVDIIAYTIGLERFQTTHESQRAMDDLAISAEVKASLIHLKPDIEVSAKNGTVYVDTISDESREAKLTQEIQEIARGVPGVDSVRINVLPTVPYGD
jgi:cytidylate kinase